MNVKLAELLSADIEAMKVVLTAALAMLSKESHDIVAMNARNVAAAYRDNLLFESVSERYADRLVVTVESLLLANEQDKPQDISFRADSGTS